MTTCKIICTANSKERIDISFQNTENYLVCMHKPDQDAIVVV